MPYASAAQRGYMHAQHPEIASRWDKEIHDSKRRKRKDVGKAASSGTFERAGSTVVPLNQRPARRGKVVRNERGRGEFSRGTRKVEKAGDWKTIEQREGHQRRNRKRIEGGLGVAGASAAGLGIVDRNYPGTIRGGAKLAFYGARYPKVMSQVVRAGHVPGRALAGAGLMGVAAGGLGVAGGARVANMRHQRKINERRRKRYKTTHNAVKKGQPFTPTPTLLQQGKPPSQQGMAGTNMGTLAGQRAGNPQTSAQSMTGASGQQAAKKPAQIGQAAQQKPAGTLVPTKAVKPQAAVTKADLHPDDRLRSQTPFHGRRPRQYDPESRRQRGHGVLIATSGIAGGAATASGTRQVIRRSKRVKGAIAIDRKAGTRLGAGAAGLGVAYGLHRRAEDPRRRKYT